MNSQAVNQKLVANNSNNIQQTGMPAVYNKYVTTSDCYVSMSKIDIDLLCSDLFNRFRYVTCL